jgi:hypothetical protein
MLVNRDGASEAAKGLVPAQVGTRGINSANYYNASGKSTQSQRLATKASHSRQVS